MVSRSWSPPYRFFSSDSKWMPGSDTTAYPCPCRYTLSPKPIWKARWSWPSERSIDRVGTSNYSRLVANYEWIGPSSWLTMRPVCCFYATNMRIHPYSDGLPIFNIFENFPVISGICTSSGYNKLSPSQWQLSPSIIGRWTLTLGHNYEHGRGRKDPGDIIIRQSGEARGMIVWLTGLVNWI